jgi:phage gpG-like protein
VTGQVAEVVGRERLAATLHRAADQLAHMDNATEQAANLIRVRAQGRAPKHTGALAGSIRASHTGATAEAASSRVYAGVQEYGWPGHHIAAQPYLRPAAEDTEGVWINYYRAELVRIIGTVEGA